MFTPFCRQYPLTQKLTGSVLNVSKSFIVCPLNQTQLVFSIKSNYTQRYYSLFTHLFNII
ncbi:hypothetical protein Hanom_Chr12g01099791 [Helianthus anomalus]